MDLGRAKTSSLYWGVYKNLENELMSLSNIIHIDDKQLDVYSVKIASLLISTCVEIEAISKELYFLEGGKEPEKESDLFFDTDCLALLNEKWDLAQKKIIIVSPNLFIENKEDIEFAPLHKAHKRGSSGASWARAYQAVKHNRVKSLNRGTLRQFIKSLGALYLLNVYLVSNKFDLGNTTSGFDARLGSDVFSVKVASCTGFSLKPESSLFIKPYCPYLIKFTEDTRGDCEQVIEEMGTEINSTVEDRFNIYIFST